MLGASASDTPTPHRRPSLLQPDTPPHTTSRVLGIRSNTNITAEILDAGKDLLAVGCFCIGTNQVDLAAAAERGIAVFNAPFSNTRSVVELVLGEIIALARRLTEKTDRMHEGIWDKSAKGSHEIRGRTLGIVGYGNIGTQLSNMAEAVGLRVIFFDTADRLAHGNARRVGSLEELLAEADVVSLHVDGRPGNAGLFGAEQFAMMKDRAIFINASRGMVVDYDVLRENVLRAASPARRSTSSRWSRRRRATRSSRRCAASTTSSSPRTSAARPSRRRRRSATSCRPSSSASSSAAGPRCR